MSESSEGSHFLLTQSKILKNLATETASTDDQHLAALPERLLGGLGTLKLVRVGVGTWASEQLVNARKAGLVRDMTCFH
jgi:hypothetical protein